MLMGISLGLVTFRIIEISIMMISPMNNEMMLKADKVMTKMIPAIRYQVIYTSRV